MAKSTTRRAGAARAGFEYFDRRQMGPWVLLRPLFRGRGLLVTLVIAAAVMIWQNVNPYVMAVVLAVLFLASFAVVWQGIGLMVRSRAVLFAAAALFVGNWWSKSLFGGLAGNLLFVALLLGLLVCPPTRRYLLRRFWCVLDRHRIRACLKVCKVRTMNLDGALPFMLWARPTKTGERIWIWVRAGASAEDIDDALSYIAPACFARDARTHRVRKLATLVAVEIVRRDPLSTGNAIPSPLAHLIAMVKGDVHGEGTETIQPATVYDITTVDPVVPEPRKNGRKPVNTKTPIEPADTTVVVSGEDLSDYID